MTALEAPYRNGHMHRPHPCAVCDRPTRRTVAKDGGRYVVCSSCELPGAEERLLMAVFNVDTLSQLLSQLRARARA